MVIKNPIAKHSEWYKGEQNKVYKCEYMKQSLFSNYYLLIIVLFIIDINLLTHPCRKSENKYLYPSLKNTKNAAELPIINGKGHD